MTTTSSIIDLTETKATAGSQISSVEDATYATARARTTGADSLYLTASERVLVGNPCASTTRKKDQMDGDLTIQVTKGSRDNSLTVSEEREVISPKQLRFTAAISKAMSKQLAPFLAGRDSPQARPSVFGCPKRSPLTAGSWSCAAI